MSISYVSIAKKHNVNILASKKMSFSHKPMSRKPTGVKENVICYKCTRVKANVKCQYPTKKRWVGNLPLKP
eukprot:scaffold203441_cov28-Attheya_sp.AAC.1